MASVEAANLIDFGSQLDRTRVARHEHRILQDLFDGDGLHGHADPSAAPASGSSSVSGYVPPRSVWQLMSAYDIVGAADGAEEEELSRLYKRKALAFHPDRHPNQPADVREYFKMVTAAFEMLRDPSRRHEYDAAGRPPVTSLHVA